MKYITGSGSLGQTTGGTQTTTETPDPCDGPITNLSDPRRSVNYQLQPGEVGINDYNNFINGNTFHSQLLCMYSIQVLLDTRIYTGIYTDSDYL